MLSRVVVVTCVLGLLHHPAFADRKKTPPKPWSVDFSFSSNETRKSIDKRAGHKGEDSRTTTTQGGGHMSWEPEPDATPTQFVFDGNNATNGKNDGKGTWSFSESGFKYNDDCKANEKETTDASASSDCVPFAEVDTDQGIWQFGVGCKGKNRGGSNGNYFQGSAPNCKSKSTSSQINDDISFGADCTNSSPNAKMTRDKDGITFDCTILEDFSKDSNSDEEISGQKKVTLHGRLLFKDVVGYDAEIQAVDWTAYTKWRPEGPPLDGTLPKGKFGNELQFRVVVRDRATRQIVDKPYATRWGLVPSEVRGIAMNYPPVRDAVIEDDLLFRKEKNPQGTVVGKGRGLQLTKGKGNAIVTVSSRDWGAYGTLGASIDIEGQTIAARFTNQDTQKDVESASIPYDEDHNHIADQWERDKNLWGKDLPATSDDEDKPAMYNTGDGYSLYDEYRGFYLQDGDAKDKKAKASRHELDPSKRELLIAISGQEEIGYRGAQAFAKAAELEIFFVPDKKYLGPSPNDVDNNHPRLSNFNWPRKDHLDDLQAAVWVIFDHKFDKSPGPANTPNVASFPDEGFGSPMTTEAIFIDEEGCAQGAHDLQRWAIKDVDPTWGPVKSQRLQAAMKKRGVTKESLTKTVEATLLPLTREMMEFTVVHELGHATGARHHDLDRFLKCNRSCNFEQDCAVCDPFTETSKRTMKCSVAHEPGKGADLSAQETEPHIKDQAWLDAHTWSCYPGQAERYGGGDENCPMRYWQNLDGEAEVKYLLGEWNPALGPPQSAAWKFCAENKPTMRLHQSPADWLKAHQ